MCGIAGIVGGGRSGVDLPSVIRKMTGAQVHRGPDAEGFFDGHSAAFGHRRLSIIDPSESANQPMRDRSGRYVITFNGEIYNFRQIRGQLKAYPFRTSSDTEVILAAFAEWGEAAVDRLKGQFAFSIWDIRDEKLFLARDRLGEKPFYYYQGNGVFVFASEIRALLSSDLIPRKISGEGLFDYLLNESVCSPRTIVADISQIPAGHLGWFEKGKLELRRYWNPLFERHEADGKDYSAVCRDIRHLLDDSIDGQMVSDVPIGAFLSGGIDSSAIVGLMAQRSSSPVNTLSVTFDDKQFDESHYSCIVARRFNTKHHAVRLRPETFLEELPEYFRSVDAPSGDGPNTYIVSKSAKRAGLTVVLSGVGGDELFAGYDTFKRYLAFQKYGFLWRFPRMFKDLAAFVISSAGGSHRAKKAASLVALDSDDAEGFYELSRGVFLRREAADLLSVSTRQIGGQANESARYEDGFRALPSLSQISVLELVNYMQNVLLKDTDNMAMANSLEVRLPFCDHRLVEYMLAVPDQFKIGNRPKQLLVDALDGLLPAEIVDRPKMGFAFPWGKWIRNELNTFCSNELKDLSQRDMFDRSKIDGLWEHYNRQHGLEGWSQIWLLVTLEQWLKRCGL